MNLIKIAESYPKKINNAAGKGEIACIVFKRFVLQKRKNKGLFWWKVEIFFFPWKTYGLFETPTLVFLASGAIEALMWPS